MKASFLYILTFIVAFLAVTGLLIIANEKFQNIFRFDFSPSHSVAVVDSTSRVNIAGNKAVKDTVVEKKDSVSVVIKDTTKIPETKIEPATEKTEVQLAKKEPEKENKINQQIPKNINKPETEQNKIINNEVVQVPKVPDSTYNKWKKATIKIYEAMDARKVSQIIRSMPDDEARELIYSMKKKKAAEILSNLNAEVVKKLTRLQ